jgi:hypothetical protein
MTQMAQIATDGADGTDMKTDTETSGRWPGAAADDPLSENDPLLAAVRALDDRPPAADLWPGIEARLGEKPAAANVMSFTPKRTVSFTLPQLAMAATLLIAVSAGVSWLALRPKPASPPVEEPAIRAVVEPVDAVQPDIQRATFADAQYDAAVADLERILREESQRLDPQTVMVIERNLRAIDQAIRESRAALDADPANTYLNSHLADARRRKLELLRRAAGLSSGG